MRSAALAAFRFSCVALPALMLLSACSDQRAGEPTPLPTANRSTELPRLSSNAPADRVLEGHDPTKDPKMQALIAEARAQLPAVRKRFLAGLPPGQHLTVTTIIRAGASAEQVFVSVERWDTADLIDGLLATQAVLPGFRPGDVLTVKAADVLDWTISRADGSEEGNLLGKYLDTMP